MLLEGVGSSQLAELAPGDTWTTRRTAEGGPGMGGVLEAGEVAPMGSDVDGALESALVHTSEFIGPFA